MEGFDVTAMCDSESIDEVCTMEVYFGDPDHEECGMTDTQFFYNDTSGQCEEFEFMYCDEAHLESEDDENRFDTMAACQQTCK